MYNDTGDVMKTKNPFPYSLDNKRYQTWNWYLQTQFKQKTAKIPLNAGFSCPNRDGTKAYGGCTFCSAKGSGDFAGSPHEDLEIQYENGRKMMERKWPNCLTIPYFQAYTNTYGPLSKIKHCISPFLEKEEVVAIALGTRADCLSDECIAFLNECTKKKEIWIELGLQSIFDKTAQHINRAHTYQEFKDTVKRLSHTQIKICVHLMNGLPNETSEMMLETAKQVAQLPIHAVKIHMLHLIKGTKMAEESFPLLTMEEYVDITVKQLEVLPSHFIIQRLTGDGVAEDLIGPEWTKKKTIVLNEIDKRMVALDTWQGKYYEQR